MRYGSEHRAETRARVLKSAAREIRLNGPDNIGIADIMTKAGLTHGGFYAHFPSKEALVAEAIDDMFAHLRLRVHVTDSAQTNDLMDSSSRFRSFLKSYLSTEHRDQPEIGCPLPSLAADMARNSGDARARFAAGLSKLTSDIEAALASLGVASSASEARAVVSQLVGAVALARVAEMGEQSEAILRDTLASITSRLGL